MMRFALGLTFAVLASGCGGDLAPTLVHGTPDGGSPPPIPPVTITDSGPMGAVDDGGAVVPIEPTVNENTDSGSPPPVTTADASVTPPTLGLDDPNRLPFACPASPATKVPTQLAQFPGGDSLAIDPQYLYFTDNGQATIGRIAPTGGSPQTIVTGQPGPFEIHVHGSQVCWRTSSSQSDAIWCSSTATLMPTQVLSTVNPGGNITSFDFDDQYAYYTFAPYVFRAPLDGSAQPEVFAADDEPRTPYSPMAVTLANGKVYWATIHAGGAGAIKSCPAGATCTPQVLGSFLGSDAFIGASNLAVSDTHVYWMSRLDSADISHGDILRVPIGGGTPVRLATCDESPRAVAIDSQAVYWITALWGPNSIQPGNEWRLPLDGSPPTRLAVLADVPRALAVGDGHVFWMTGGTTPALFGAIVP